MVWLFTIIRQASVFDANILLLLHFSADSADKWNYSPPRAFGSDYIYWAENAILLNLSKQDMLLDSRGKDRIDQERKECYETIRSAW